MIVRRLEDVQNSSREVKAGAWTSRRLVLAGDKVDFSFHDTVVKADSETRVWYKNHFESVYCLEGEGKLINNETEESFEITPGTVYVVDQHEEHTLYAQTDMRLISVFNPPLTGTEVHDESGSYPALAPRKHLRKKNIYAVGLNSFNLHELQSIRNAENYNFLPLLSPEDVLERQDYPIQEILDKARSQLSATGETVDGLIHYIDFPVSTTVPIISREYSLPSASLEAVLKCEHKYWARVEAQKCIPENIPAFGAFDPFDERALEKLNMPFPFWVKPIKSFSSYLGFRVDNEKDWENAIKETRENISRFSGPFDWLLSQADLPEDIKKVGGGYCIAESIISGRQCTQEGFVHKGQVKIYGTVDSVRETNGSSFSSYQYPSRLPATVRKRMSRLTEKFMQQVGYDNAPFNVEFFWDANQDNIWLLEVNPRISESHADLFWKVDGASHHEVAVDLSLGQRPRLPHRDGEFAVAGKFFIRHYSDGVVTRLPDPSDLQRLQQEQPQTYVKVLPKMGQRLSDMMDQDSYSYNLALLWIGASNHKQLQKKFEKAVEMLPFEFRDN